MGAFYGARAGTFFFYLLIILFGMSFIQSEGTRKIANIGFSVMVIIIFANNKVIDYIWAIPLFLGTSISSYFCVKYNEHIGNNWIKRIFVVTVMFMSLNLLFF